MRQRVKGVDRRTRNDMKDIEIHEGERGTKEGGTENINAKDYMMGKEIHGKGSEKDGRGTTESINDSK